MARFGYNPYGGYRSSGLMGRGLTPGVKFLLISNIAVFIMQLMTGDWLIRIFGLTPTDILLTQPTIVVGGQFIDPNPPFPAIYQLVTYMFLHGGWLHILLNMFVLWMFGSEIEASWGTKRFFKYYFLTGIAGGIFTVIFQPHFAAPTIGASAAIYGLLVAYAVMFPNRLIYIYFLFPVKVKYAVIAFVALEFFASFSGRTDGIGHFAHLGGAIVGFLFLKLDWRLRYFWQKISPFGFLKSLRYKRKIRKVEKNRTKTEEVMKRVDEILDKINEVGIENISEEERRFLGNASDSLSEKDK